MRNSFFALLLLTSMSYAARSQSLPSNTCGIVYTYDAAGNRTQRKYICNNGSAAMSHNMISNSLNIKDNVQKVDRLYPNPTTGRFTVTFSKPLDRAQVILTDMAGVVLQHSVHSGNQLDFDISRQPSGMYLLRIQDGSTNITQKVVKL